MNPKTGSQEPNGRLTAIPLQVALGSGIVAGSIDLILTMLPGPVSLSEPLAVLAPLTATAAVAAGSCLVLLTLLAPVRFLMKLQSGSWNLALGITLLFLFCGIFLIEDVRLGKDLSSLAEAGLIMFGLATVQIACYSALRSKESRPRAHNRTLATVIAVPALFLEAVAFVWFQKFMLEGLVTLQSALSVLVFLFVAGGTLGVSLRSRSPQIRSVVNPGLAVLLIVSSGLTLALPEADLQPPPSATGERHPIPNVILISVDTLRADVVSGFSPESSLTPNLEKLRHDSVTFRQAISTSPWTLPSLSAIMSGLLPTVTQVMAVNSRLSAGHQTLAERFRAAGYMTGGAGYNGFLAPIFQLTQGFQEFSNYPDASLNSGFGFAVLQKFFPEHYASEATSEDLADLALEWIGKYRDQEFFYWLHFYDPHTPYAPPEEYLPDLEIPTRIGLAIGGGQGPMHLLSLARGVREEFSQQEREWIKHLYDAEVRYVDDQIGRVVDKLRELDLYDDSLIVFFSDHGEEFWEHDGLTHGRTLHDELLWVPLMFKLPQSAATSVVETRISTVNIMPTILELAGLDYDPESLSGRSLTPLFSAGATAADWPAVFSMALLRQLENKESVYFDDLKYIRTVVTHRDELFDLDSDPNEQINIDRERPGLVRLGSALLEARAASDSALANKIGIDTGASGSLDAETIKQLEDLGYL